ncbi:MAG: putative Ig domain-containing protein [Nitrospirota bacterium]
MNTCLLNFRWFLSALVLYLVLIPGARAHGEMEDYCIIPPYVKRDIKPNILIIMDNAEIMGNQAYTDGYDPGARYTGLFREDLMYSYTGSEWDPDPAGIYSGNLLNWATTSQYDLLESILVGGKSISRQTNVHRLVSVSNSWKKILNYRDSLGRDRTCVFEIDSANLRISDQTAGSCGYLDDPPYPMVSATGSDTRFADSIREPGGETPANQGVLLTGFLRHSLGVLNRILSFLVPDAEAVAPLRMTTSSLPRATENTPYSAAVSATGGTESGYTWSILSGSLPAGLSLEAGGTPTTYITGTPSALPGTYSFTIQVCDSAGCIDKHIDSDDFTLTVDAGSPVIRKTGNREIKVCAGTYDCNCNTAYACGLDTCAGSCNETYCPGDCLLKSGIVDQFWPQARMGIMDFSRTGGYPILENCVESNPGPLPDPNFLTAIENATPSKDITRLVDGEYFGIDYYANNTEANCDPFRNSQACQKNFILMITSGVGANNPPDPAAEATPNVFADATNCGSAAYANLSKNSCFGYANDLRDAPTFGGNNQPGRQYVNTYIVNTMGTPTTPIVGLPPGSCVPSAAPVTTGDILCQAANVGGGSYYQVVDATYLREALIQAFQDIIKRAAAGTAASVLASGEGSGANLIQAVFYPRRKVGDVEVAWTGRLTNFWFYNDPFFNQSSIYEDNSTAKILDLSSDNRITLFYDISSEKTMAHRYPPAGTLSDIPFEDLASLWEAGVLLWQKGASARNIWTSVNGTWTSFDTAHTGSLMSSLGLPTTDGTDSDVYLDGDLDHDGDVDSDDANMLIQYIRGVDYDPVTYPWMRSRTVSIDIDGSGSIGAGEANVWKLGDILNSTPKIASWIQLNTYDQIYGDTSYKNFLTIAGHGYTERGMVYAGGNDGMLHAFKLGKMELLSSDTQKAELAGATLGDEKWAFMPQNVLPYLKYLPRTDYCHVYTVDLTPYVFDASIGTGIADSSGNARPDCANPDDAANCTWRTLLIGGMRFGGACKNACTDADCIQTPQANLGYSTYFALDVTDSLEYPDDLAGHPPVLLWEFSSEDLGLTTTGPAVVRVGDKATNGKWFVVFGSGPTGPVSKTDQQFLGRSNQNLRLFILDLKTGTLLRTLDTGIANAFAGSMLNVTVDADVNYQDDMLYIGYVKKAGDGTWTQGGVGRLQTKEDTSPANWAWSTVLDNIGPVTSSVTRLINRNKGQLWMFFGTGRYYFEQLATVDDEHSQRTLFGIKDPCYSTAGLDADCTVAFSGTITDVSNTPDADPDAIADGWKIDLDLSGDYTYLEGNPAVAVTRNYRAERMITDPLATGSGIVFFTTYKPYNDVCAYGGKTFIWAVRYNAGSAPGALLKGIALLQVSTGSIEQVSLADAFPEKGGRRTSALEGVPPTAQGLSLISTPPPVKRVLHIRER